MDSYLNLKSLIERGGEQKVAAVLQEAVRSLPPDVFTVTLDLDQSRDLFPEAEVETLVEVIRTTWPRPAFCLARCDNPSAWNRAASRFSQPLLDWKAFARQGGYQVLGPAPRGDYAPLLRVLCLNYGRATAEQLSRDPQIVSPQKMNYDAHSLMEFARTGRPPLGPTLADVDRIDNDLRNMVRLRYVLAGAPRMYRVVSPVPPSSGAAVSY